MPLRAQSGALQARRPRPRKPVQREELGCAMFRPAGRPARTSSSYAPACWAHGHLLGRAPHEDGGGERRAVEGPVVRHLRRREGGDRRGERVGEVDAAQDPRGARQGARRGRAGGGGDPRRVRRAGAGAGPGEGRAGEPRGGDRAHPRAARAVRGAQREPRSCSTRRDAGLSTSRRCRRRSAAGCREVDGTSSGDGGLRYPPATRTWRPSGGGGAWRCADADEPLPACGTSR